MSRVQFRPRTEVLRSKTHGRRDLLCLANAFGSVELHVLDGMRSALQQIKIEPLPELCIDRIPRLGSS